MATKLVGALRLRYRIASALPGEPSPPGILIGAATKKNVHRLWARHAERRPSKSNISPSAVPRVGSSRRCSEPMAGSPGTTSTAGLQPMLALPPVVGGSVIPNTTSVDRAGGWTVEAIESLTVPAGTFDDCARIGLGGDSKAWLCPGVGLVKWIFVTGRVEELSAWEIPGGTSGP